MSQLPERYRAAIAPLIDKARELLEQGEELVPMAFVGNFTTGATIPTALVMRSPADKDAAARTVKLADGTMTRLNYADQNGYPYQSIGRVLVDRGEL